MPWHGALLAARPSAPLTVVAAALKLGALAALQHAAGINNHEQKGGLERVAPSMGCFPAVLTAAASRHAQPPAARLTSATPEGCWVLGAP